MVLTFISIENIKNDLFPILTEYVLPIGLWMAVPAVIFRLIFKSRLSFQVGALLGLALCFFIGPFS